MSKLNGMQIFELLSDVNDNLIVESVSPALLAGGATGAVAGLTGNAGASSVTGSVPAAAGSTVAGTAAKTGFAAWLAKGGWLAVLAGVLVAAGVAVGIALGGKDPAGTLPAGSDDVTTVGVEQSEPEETDKETADGAEGDTHDEMTGDAEITSPVFDVDASLAAIDQLASENLSVSLKYQTKTYDGLSHDFNGGLGQVDGKHWYRVDMDGTAVLEEEGGYYHKYTFELSKWRYYNTYEMTDRKEYDKVLNGRYWWKNYLDELMFEAYDALSYTGMGQVLEQDCYVFSYEGEVMDGSQVKLTLYVDAESRNVMKMETEITSGTGSHMSTDARQATIEISSLKTGDAAKGPTLPDPKWDPPTDETNDPSQGGIVIPPSDQNPSIDPGNGMLEQYPLLSPDDAASYVVLPELLSGEETAVMFYVLPTDMENPAHTCAWRYEIPAYSVANIQIVAVEKSPDEYCFLFMLEYLEELMADGEEAYRVVMICAELQFFDSARISEVSEAYYTVHEHQYVELFYTLSTMQSVIDENRDRSLEALNQAQAWLNGYTEDAGYTYTVLYAQSQDGDLIKTPVNRIPSFLFDLYREYGLAE